MGNYLAIAKVVGENDDGTLNAIIYPSGHSALDLTKGGKFITLTTAFPLFDTQGNNRYG